MKKRILSFLLALLLVVSLAPFSAVPCSAALYDGTCGENLTWTLDSDTGVLTISGTGDMNDFTTPSGYPIIGSPITYAPWLYFSDIIKTVTVENGVTSIGEYAFPNCRALTEISLPSSLKKINDYAFFNCTALKNITIPENVESIGDSDVFQGAGLTEICVNGENSVYKSIDGVLFTKEPFALIWYPKEKANTEYTVPDGVTAIGDFAFDNPYKLESIRLPESLETIGRYAFVHSVKIRKFDIPKNVKEIGYDAFAYCDVLEELNVSESNPYFTGIDGVLFDKAAEVLIKYPECKADTYYEIPETVEIIEEGAFKSSVNIETVIIPDSVKTIGNDAFRLITSLRTVSFGNGVETIGKSAFFDNRNLESIELPESVRSIGETAFGFCSSVETIVIHSKLTAIGTAAFYYCSSLTSLTIEEGTESLSEMMFNECTSLTEVKLPSSLKVINADAFSGCQSLKTLDLPDGIVTIEYGAFQYCDSLKTVAIPKSVTSINPYAFNRSNRIDTVYYAGTEEEWEENLLRVVTNADTGAEVTNIIFEYSPAVVPNNAAGDANGDGRISISDVLNIRKYIAGVENPADENAADVNKDGRVTIADVLLVRKYIAGLITEFPER